MKLTAIVFFANCKFICQKRIYVSTLLSLLLLSFHDVTYSSVKYYFLNKEGVLNIAGQHNPGRVWIAIEFKVRNHLHNYDTVVVM